MTPRLVPALIGTLLVVTACQPGRIEPTSTEIGTAALVTADIGALTFDAECLVTIGEDLSDSDAASVAAGLVEKELSPQGREAMLEAYDCAARDDVIEVIAEQSDASVECLEESVGPNGQRALVRLALDEDAGGTAASEELATASAGEADGSLSSALCLALSATGYEAVQVLVVEYGETVPLDAQCAALATLDASAIDLDEIVGGVPSARRQEVITGFAGCLDPAAFAQGLVADVETTGLVLDTDCVTEWLTPERILAFVAQDVAAISAMYDACVDFEQFVDGLFADLPALERSLIDRECAIETFRGLGFGALIELGSTGGDGEVEQSLIGCLDIDEIVDQTIVSAGDAGKLIDPECLRVELGKLDLGQLFGATDAESDDIFDTIGRACLAADDIVEFAILALPEGVAPDESCLRAAFDTHGVTLDSIQGTDASFETAAYFRDLYSCFSPSEFAELVAGRAAEKGADPDVIDEGCIADRAATIDLGPPAEAAAGLPYDEFVACGVEVPPED